MEEPVRMIVRFRTKPDKVGDFQSLMSDMREPTRAETGCLSYELQQSMEEPELFVFVEDWRSDADAASHLMTPHVQRILPLLGNILAAPPSIERYKKLW